MSRRLLILLPLTVPLTGCSVGHVNLPMSLGLERSRARLMLTYSGTPSDGDCKGAAPSQSRKG